MNCKPGDLAVMVRASCPENVGRIVLVLPEDPYYDLRHGHVWFTQAANPAPTAWAVDGTKTGRAKPKAHVPDAWLRPIRDPGEDARDETLEWLPVPSTRGSEAA